MNVSVLDLRYRTREILKALERGETIGLLCRGKKAGVLSPASAERTAGKAADHQAFGIWSAREDMDSPSKYVRQLRENRY